MATELEEPFPALDRAQWFGIVYRGSMAFRFGPFSGQQIGRIMVQCQEENIPLLVTAECGPEFDWDLARNMRGYPEGSPELADSEGDSHG